MFYSFAQKHGQNALSVKTKTYIYYFRGLMNDSVLNEDRKMGLVNKISMKRNSHIHRSMRSLRYLCNSSVAIHFLTHVV